jgi:hypothetical protein
MEGGRGGASSPRRTLLRLTSCPSPALVPYYSSVGFERELRVLEEAIRRLTGEYDAFLYASTAGSKPPVESRKHVDQMIRRLSAVTLDDAADRYRFSTLQGRYTALAERWERLQGEKEAGRRPGLYGHFATEPSPARSPGVEPPHSGASNAAASASVRDRGSAAATPDRLLFERYVGARRARGESVEAYVFEEFAESLKKERMRLKEKLGAEIVFDVAERDGRVKLVARRVGVGADPGAGLPAGKAKGVKK